MGRENKIDGKMDVGVRELKEAVGLFLYLVWVELERKFVYVV